MRTLKATRTTKSASAYVDLLPAPAALFPLPLRARNYLWAHHWENLPSGLYSHPEHLAGDALEQYERGGFTEAEAIADARALDAVYWQISKQDAEKPFSLAASVLWEMAAYYAWLGENDDNVSPVAVDVIAAWAAGRVPSIAALLETAKHSCLELEAL